MDDSQSDTDSGHTIKYSVRVSGHKEDHREFRRLIRENGAEIQSETPSDTTESGRPKYLQNLIDEAVNRLGEDEDYSEPIEPVMEIVCEELIDIPFNDGSADRTVYNILYDLQQLESLETEETPQDIPESTFNNYRDLHSPESVDPVYSDEEISEYHKNDWGEATIKALVHASLEMYLVEEVESKVDFEK